MVKEKSAWMSIFILQFVCSKKVGFADKKGPECSKGSKHVAKVLFGGKHQKTRDPRQTSWNIKYLDGYLMERNQNLKAQTFSLSMVIAVTWVGRGDMV